MSKEYAKLMKEAKARRAHIVRLHKSGKNTVWLAGRFGITHQRVSKILKEELRK